MSERGKYWKNPEVSSRKERIESKKDPALAPTICLPSETTNQTPGPQVTEVRKNTGCGILVALGISMAATGAVGTVGYLYIAKKPPFADETASVASSGGPALTAPDNSSSSPELPEMIYSNQDLKKAMQKHKIGAKAQDFEFETDRPELQAKAITLRPQSDSDNAENSSYSWKPVREKITRVDQEELLVAVKIINPYIGDNAYDLIVPEGLSYRARTVDPNDPSIMYFYYNCRDKKGGETQLGQIGIRNPANSKKLMWAKSFLIKSCE